MPPTDGADHTELDPHEVDQDQHALVGTKIKFGPSEAHPVKYAVARRVYWFVKHSPVSRIVRKLPGAKRAQMWAFRVVFMSRPHWEATDNE